MLFFSVSAVVCSNNYFTPVCNNTQSVLLIQTALYGRMQPGLCRGVSGGLLGCSADVRVFMDEQCSGRTSCNVDADILMDHVNQVEWPTACSPDHVAYLEVTYTCLQGETIWPNSQIGTEMCTFLFWMVDCGMWNRCIVGLGKLFCETSIKRPLNHVVSQDSGSVMTVITDKQHFVKSVR